MSDEYAAGVEVGGLAMGRRSLNPLRRLLGLGCRWRGCRWEPPLTENGQHRCRRCRYRIVTECYVHGRGQEDEAE